MHRINDRRALAVIRELWKTRDSIARRRDVAPHRILPDSAIMAAADGQADHDRRADRPAGLLRPDAATQRRPVAGRHRPGAGACPPTICPVVRPAGDGPPAAGQVGVPRPGRRRPAAGGPDRPGRAVRAGRYPGGEPAVARTRPAGCCGAHRRTSGIAAVAAALADRGARPWQIELTAPVLAKALDAGLSGPSYSPVTFAVGCRRWLRDRRMVHVSRQRFVS